MLAKPEVIHCNVDTAPPTRKHDCRQAVTVREEVLRRPDAQGVAGYLSILGVRAASADNCLLDNVAHRTPANWPVNAPLVAQCAESPGSSWLDIGSLFDHSCNSVSDSLRTEFGPIV